jgi:catechol 2,3-dioxygenase-like lactoylglutathione lyase family enzyme
MGFVSRSQFATRRTNLPNQLHHVVMRSHSAETFIKFLTDVVGMDIQAQFHVAGDVLETTLGWPPSDGAELTMLGHGDAGLIEVLDVPEHLREVAPEGLAALSFLTDDYHRTQDRARTMANDVTVLFGDVPGVNLFFCTMGGVPMEFMGSYSADDVQVAAISGDGQ